MEQFKSPSDVCVQDGAQYDTRPQLGCASYGKLVDLMTWHFAFTPERYDVPGNCETIC